MPNRRNGADYLSYKKLTINDVKELGVALIRVADLYPTQFLTERDFFPLVFAYLSGRVPGIAREVQSKQGVVDFRIGGTNPTWLELAVQPRQLSDKNYAAQHFPGHSTVNTLYAGQNRTELTKLMHEHKGATRFLLLLDLSGKYDFESLVQSYRDAGIKIAGTHPVRVVYVTRDSSKIGHFLVPKTKK